MGDALLMMFVPDLKSIPDDMRPSASIRREIKKVLVGSGSFVRQVDNEQSGLGTFRWLPSSQGNAGFSEQQFRCIKRTAVPDSSWCALLAGCGKHLEAQSECPKALVPARILKLKSTATNMTACFFIIASANPNYTLVF
jgi:hypothetical protein